MKYLLDRLKEPSTYAGLAALLGLIGVHVSADQSAAIIQAICAIFSAVAMFVPEKKTTTLSVINGGKR